MDVPNNFHQTFLANFANIANRREHTYSLTAVGLISDTEDGRDSVVLSGRSAVTVVVAVVVTVTVDGAAVLSGQRYVRVVRPPLSVTPSVHSFGSSAQSLSRGTSAGAKAASY
jgi:hypothetical protein